MCCSHLLFLSVLIEEDKISRLETFLSECSDRPALVITVSRVATTIDVSPQLASKVLQELAKKDILTTKYALRCPECGTLLKRYSGLNEVECVGNICYKCNEKFDVSPEEIEIFYIINDGHFFRKGQHEKEVDYSVSAAHENSLKFLIESGGINNLLFNPNDLEYTNLRSLYSDVFNQKTTTKAKGDTLERLVAYLFGLCEAFKTGEIRTSTNQIDCFVANEFFCNLGIFGQIGPRIIIECKNEEKTPKVDYIEKLGSIISLANAGAQANYVRLGIIVSKAKPPRTYKSLANRFYLSNKIVIISLCKEDLSELVEKKKNLLEMIERKMTEVVMETTTDLRRNGIYNA